MRLDGESECDSIILALALRWDLAFVFKNLFFLTTHQGFTEAKLTLNSAVFLGGVITAP